MTAVEVATRDALHHAAQALGMAARLYIPPQPDDSHTALGWDADAKAFRVALPGATLRLVVADAELRCRGTAGEQRLALAGTTRAALDAMLRAWLADAGLDAARFTLDPPYELPHHPVQDGARFAFDRASLEALASLYTDTHAALEALVLDGRSPVRTWPHHFDMAVLVALESGDPEHARSVGLGLSPGDAGHAAPYRYATPWPYPDATRLGAAPAGWRWNTAGWTGLVREARVGEAAGYEAAYAACHAALG